MRSVHLSLLVLCVSCATLNGGNGGGEGLPSAGAGPFRTLKDGELASAAVVPYVFADSTASYREPSVTGSSDDPSSASVWMYAVATVGGTSVIVRTSADDARSFYGDVADNADTSHSKHTAPTVLSADQGWEGVGLGGPSVVRSGGQVWLYYAAAGGIGLAQSGDGLTFTKQSKAVLAPDSSVAWESTVPHAPTVAVFPDGTWHMLYGAGNAIGEATSPDGVAWTRAGDPVLTPSATVDPSTLPAGDLPPFDEGGIDDPVLAPQTTIDGRLQVRVLYTGYRQAPGTTPRDSAIGLAGRFGDSGPLLHQAAPVYTAQLHETAPAFFEYSGGSFIYVGEDDTSLSTSSPFPAIAAGYSPATGTLPAPSPFPSAP